MTRKPVLFLAATLVLSLPALAAADCGTGPKWLWSSQSALVNRSTQALATGRPARAADFARRVLANSPSATDAKIAAHNLCLAAIAGGAAVESDPDCAAALAGRQDSLMLCGTDDRAAEAGSLTALIRANIAAAAGHAIVPPTETAQDR